MPGILDLLPQPQQGPPEPDFKTQYIRPELMGGLGTPAISAFLQMFDPMGLSPAQLDQNAAMRGPLLRSAYQQYPELLGQPYSGPQRPGAASMGEDLNSIMLKFANWKKQTFPRLGEDALNPQERITQGFMDVRNPNSRF